MLQKAQTWKTLNTYLPLKQDHYFFSYIRTGRSQPARRCFRQRSTTTRLYATPNRRVGTLRSPTFGNLSATARVSRLRKQNSRQILRNGFGKTRSHRWE